jgi:CHASE2 domain-containing sensor protein
MLIVPVYGTFLCLLAMGGFFIFFMTFRIRPALKLGICCIVGAIIFYASDSFLAHGKFDTAYQEKVSPTMNSILLMVTYYVAQYLMGKAGLSMAEYTEENGKNPQSLRQVTPEGSHVIPT